MPLLGPTDPLPFTPRRVAVSGTTGSGKSTLARRIGTKLTLPYTELDSLFHGPDWTPRESFVEDVDRFTAEPAWVTEFQYDQARPMLVERAHLMVWLDISRRLVMWRVARRTVSRRWRRTELWNGNKEAPLRTFFRDPEHIIRWAWNTHPTTAERAGEALRRRPELVVVRLTSTTEVESWLDGPASAREAATRSDGGTPA